MFNLLMALLLSEDVVVAAIQESNLWLKVIVVLMAVFLAALTYDIILLKKEVDLLKPKQPLT